jgi:hypothetical protein
MRRKYLVQGPPNDYLPDSLCILNGAKRDAEAYNVGDTTQELSPQTRGSELPVSGNGNCQGALSLPLWHCIFLVRISPQDWVFLMLPNSLTCHHPAL